MLGAAADITDTLEPVPQAGDSNLRFRTLLESARDMFYRVALYFDFRASSSRAARWRRSRANGQRRFTRHQDWPVPALHPDDHELFSRMVSDPPAVPRLSCSAGFIPMATSSRLNTGGSRSTTASAG